MLYIDINLLAWSLLSDGSFQCQIGNRNHEQKRLFLGCSPESRDQDYIIQLYNSLFTRLNMLFIELYALKF